MTNSSLIENLDSLLPEIQKTRDPEGVLLKFAAKENLSAAHLERMAQLYNTAKTLTHMKKSADRGSNFSIIETEDLLARYTEPEAPKGSLNKAASAEPDLDAISSWVDVKHTAVSEHRFPDVELMEMSRALDQVSKQASASPIASPRDQWKERCETDRNNATLLQVRDDHLELGYELINKLASRIHDEGLPFSEVEQDIFESLGSQDVCDRIADRLTSRGIKFERTKSATRRRLVVDRHSVVTDAAKAVEALDVATTAAVLYKEAAVASPKREAVSIPEEFRDNPDAAFGYSRGQQAARASMKDLVAAPPGVKAPGEEPKRTTKHEPEGKPRKVEFSEEPRERGEQGKGKSSEKGLFERYVNWGTDTSTPGALESAVDRTQSWMDLIGGKDKRQESRDTAHDETQAAVVLQRLLLSDPIISAADPKVVTSLSNSIRQANPEASRDINVMKALLREAIQYDSLPSHTYKDLTSVRESTAKTKDFENKNREALYGQKK